MKSVIFAHFLLWMFSRNNQIVSVAETRKSASALQETTARGRGRERMNLEGFTIGLKNHSTGKTFVTCPMLTGNQGKICIHIHCIHLGKCI